MKIVIQTAALTAALLLVSACGGGSNVKAGDGAADSSLAAGGGGGAAGAANGTNGNGEFGYGSDGIIDGAGVGGQSGVESQFAGLNDPASPLYTRVIYFDYNATGIGAEYQTALLAHAQLLADNPRRAFPVGGPHR